MRKVDLSQMDIGISDFLKENLSDRLSTSSVEYFRDKIILVTGAAGSVGSELSRQLTGLRFKLIILFDQNESELYNLHQLLTLKNPNLPILSCIGDITRIEDIKPIFVKYEPQIVFHAAAYKQIPMSQGQPVNFARTNILGTKYVADLCLEYGIEKMVLVSTDKVIKPQSVLGQTKLVAEKYLRYLSLNSRQSCSFITSRFGNVLESRGSLIPLWKLQIKNSSVITVTHPEATRYFMTVEKAASFLLTSCAIGKAGDVLFIDMGEPVRILDIANQLIAESEVEVSINFIGLRPGDKLHEEPMTYELNTKKTSVSNVYRYIDSADSLDKNEFTEVEKAIHECKENDVIALMNKMTSSYITPSTQMG